MTATQRVRSTRARLGVAAIVAAVVWGAALTAGVLVLVSLTSALAPQVARATAWGPSVAIAVGIVLVAILLWRSRHLLSPERVALWIEEQIPRLQYSLLAALEPQTRGSNNPGVASSLEAAVGREDIGGVTRRAVYRTVIPALAAALVAIALLQLSSNPAFGRNGLLAGIGARAPGNLAEAGSRLENLQVVVTPPRYTGARSVTLDNPSSVPALTGSTITVTGSGSPQSLRAAVAGSNVRIAGDRRGWRVTFTMPRNAAALVLGDRQHERLLVLEPRPDAPPKITLLRPVRDSTLRSPRLEIRLAANASDDVGLNGAYFEYLVTTGSGEIFSARTIATPAVRFGGAGTGAISAVLNLVSLKLGQGDVVSIRAIAHDGNALSGPGIGTSDTRTFRIARADEYDSVSVDAAAPPPIDSSAMSQRMLIIMTEDLVKREKTLSRAELVKQSTAIGDLEDRIRKRVDAILNASDSPDEQAHLEEAGHVHTADENAGPVNKDLLEAYNALWEAVRSLQIAEPRPALPPMRVALKALDRARLANRLYLRGVPPKVIVDLARVRLAGKEKGVSSTRLQGSAADTARMRLGARFNDAIGMLPDSSAGALRSLTLLRVGAISTAPSFAAALGEAVDAMRSGRDATVPLLRARRALEGEPNGVPGLSAWSGGW